MSQELATGANLGVYLLKALGLSLDHGVTDLGINVTAIEPFEITIKSQMQKSEAENFFTSLQKYKLINHDFNLSQIELTRAFRIFTKNKSCGTCGSENVIFLKVDAFGCTQKLAGCQSCEVGLEISSDDY